MHWLDLRATGFPGGLSMCVGVRSPVRLRRPNPVSQRLDRTACPSRIGRVIPSGYLLELFIAARYLRGQSRLSLFSLGTRLSFIFMALMVLIMVVVLSVFTGFQTEVRRSLWNAGYHVTLTRSLSGSSFQNYGTIVSILKDDPALKPQIRTVFPSITANGLLEYQNRFEGKALRALPVQKDQLVGGRLDDFPTLVHYDQRLLDRFADDNMVIVGREMARFYGWQVGDTITLFLPAGGVMTRGMQIKRADFTIAGYFRTGFYEFDMNLMFVSLSTAQRLLDLQGRATEIIVQLNDLSQLDATRQTLRESLPGNRFDYSMRTIKDERGNFLAALELEKTLMMFILGLLIVAGIAGIWVTSYLLVKAKSRSIGMLRAMGMTMRSVLIIFTGHSMLIGFLASAIGGTGGIIFSRYLEAIIQLVEDHANQACHVFSSNCVPVHLIPRQIYYFDHLPVYTDIGFVFGIAMVTMILSGFAGYFPARQAARLDPVQTIRND